jgi:hypothetical protein
VTAPLFRSLLRSQHRLNFVDQLAFELFRLTRRNQLMQCVWIYEREVDLEGLRRVCQRLCDLPCNRLIEPSPLPFGRPRWVRDNRTPSVQCSDDVLPRSSLLSWANRHAQTPLDPINGPAWHVSLQRFSDGSSAVSIVGSHLLFDGVGTLGWIHEAIAGSDVRSDFDPKQTRHPLMGVLTDGWQALLDLPQTLQALLRATRLGVASVGSIGDVWRAGRPGRPGRPDRPGAVQKTPSRESDTVTLPSVTAFIDAALWDQRARSLGGHGYSLLAALAARVAAHMDRRRPSDGAVSLLVTVNQRRGLEDYRAIAITFCKILVDPLRAAHDLRVIGASLKSAVRAAKRRAEPILKLFPIVPWMPRATTAALVDRVFTYADDLPVSCSNLGTLPARVGCIDGTPCSSLLARGVDTNVTLRDLHRSHGHLVVVASRFNGKVCVSVEAYRLDADNSAEHLRDVLQRTLSELGLEGLVEC